MDKHTSTIERELATTMQLISAAAQRGDLGMVEGLTRKASELKAIRDQFLALESRLGTLTNTSHTGSAGHNQPTALRELAISVTQGMINQNLLTLTDAVKRGAIRVGDRLIVEMPSGKHFETTLLETGNKLQERGKVAEFYRDFGVAAGDIVLLREVTPGRWQLHKK